MENLLVLSSGGPSLGELVAESRGRKQDTQALPSQDSRLTGKEDKSQELG